MEVQLSPPLNSLEDEPITKLYTHQITMTQLDKQLDQTNLSIEK